MTKCGDLGEISTRNLQVGEIDLKEHTYHKYIATMRVPEEDLHFQCILSILPADAHQLYANLHCIGKHQLFLYITNQFALKNVDLLSYITNQLLHCHLFRFSLLNHI